MNGSDGFLGIVMLDTRFPRPIGDVGHPETFAVRVVHEVVAGMWPTSVVCSAAALRAARVVPTFQAALRRLEQKGARAITTSCGFLVLLQDELQAAVTVPVVTSSLCLLPALLAAHGRVGVLTISAERLGRDHLRAAGVADAQLRQVVVQGVAADREFATSILGNRPVMNLARASADVVAASRALKARAPDIDVVVLECTNMPPYRAAIEAATGLAVRSLSDCEALFAPFGVKPTKAN